MRVLILSVAIGAGHTRASQAIVRGLQAAVPGCETRVVDAFRYANPLLGQAITGAYMEAIRLSPSAYRQLYQLAASDSLADFGKQEFNRILHMLMATRLTSLVAELVPDVIIATHPFPLGVLSVQRQQGQVTQPLVCVVTDYAAHPFWLYDNVDLYAVGSEALRQELIGAGIAAARVTTTGIPIDAAFPASDPVAARAALGVTDERPIVLLMSGGLGLGSLAGTVEDILSLSGDQLLITVCGGNNRLKESLQDEFGRTTPGRIKVLGYVDNVHELMAAADLLVSKPGGLTCAEALASGLPLVIPDTIPGPEDANADRLVALGAAFRVRGRQSLVDALAFLLRNADVRTVMRRAAAANGRPQAAVDVARAVLRVLSEEGVGGAFG